MYTMHVHTGIKLFSLRSYRYINYDKAVCEYSGVINPFISAPKIEFWGAYKRVGDAEWCASAFVNFLLVKIFQTLIR